MVSADMHREELMANVLNLRFGASQVRPHILKALTFLKARGKPNGPGMLFW